MLKDKYTEFFKHIFENLFIAPNENASLRQDKSSQAAIQLLELEMKNKELEMKNKELEASLKLTQAEILKSIVQAESMIRSVRDNAIISQANAYIGFLNVMLNAQSIANNNAGGKTHSQNVIDVINTINTEFLENYDEILHQLKYDALQLTKADGDNAAHR